VDDQRWVLKARVIPRAKSNRIQFESDCLRIHVTAPASDNRANEAAIAILAEKLSIPKSRVRLVSGMKSRNKSFEILGISQSDAASRLR
jgi:uncharacterized protein YggU (UPF0235/DUF167 family)